MSPSFLRRKVTPGLIHRTSIVSKRSSAMAGRLASRASHAFPNHIEDNGHTDKGPILELAVNGLVAALSSLISHVPEGLCKPDAPLTSKSDRRPSVQQNETALAWQRTQTSAENTKCHQPRSTFGKRLTDALKVTVLKFRPHCSPQSVNLAAQHSRASRT